MEPLTDDPPREEPSVDLPVGGSR